MLENWEKKGYWWLPENQEKKVFGILTFSCEYGLNLELYDILTGTEIGINQKSERIELILGKTIEGENITAYDSFTISQSFHTKGSIILKLKVGFAFLGAHFINLGEIKFFKMESTFSNLDNWVGLSGFNSKDNSKEKVVTYNYKFPESITISLNEQITASIDFSFSQKMSSKNGMEVQLKQKTQFRMLSKKELFFDDFLKYVYQIQNFLSFATSNPTYPNKLTFFSKKNVIDIGGEKIELPISTYYKFAFNPKFESEVNFFKFLFSFSDLKEKLSTYLKNWIKKSDTLEPLFDLYFGNIYNQNVFLKHKFLSLIYALEFYHRNIFGGVYQDRDNFRSTIYKQLCDAIPVEISDEFKTSLKSRFKYLNEFSLRKRLNDVIFKYENYFDYFIKNKEVFIEDIVNTRNYFTHYDDEIKELAKRGKELFWITEKIKFIIEICILIEIGFDEKLVVTIIERKKQNHPFLFG